MAKNSFVAEVTFKLSDELTEIMKILECYLKVTSATKQLLQVCYLRHRLRRIFLFQRKVMFHS